MPRRAGGRCCSPGPCRRAPVHFQKNIISDSIFKAEYDDHAGLSLSPLRCHNLWYWFLFRTCLWFRFENTNKLEDGPTYLAVDVVVVLGPKVPRDTPALVEQTGVVDLLPHATERRQKYFQEAALAIFHATYEYPEGLCTCSSADLCTCSSSDLYTCLSSDLFTCLINIHNNKFGVPYLPRELGLADVHAQGDLLRHVSAPPPGQKTKRGQINNQPNRVIGFGMPPKQMSHNGSANRA